MKHTLSQQVLCLHQALKLVLLGKLTQLELELEVLRIFSRFSY